MTLERVKVGSVGRGERETRGTVCEYWRWFSILVDTLWMVQYTSGYTGDGSVY